MSFLEFRIADEQSRTEWEKLLGFKLLVPTVRLMSGFYREHCAEVNAIQFAAAARVWQQRE